MSSDNGIVLNVPAKTFDGTHTKFGLFWFLSYGLIDDQESIECIDAWIQEWATRIINFRKPYQEEERKRWNKENVYGIP